MIQKTAEATGHLINNKIADKFKRVLKTSSHNNSESNEQEILRERYVSSKETQKVTDNRR